MQIFNFIGNIFGYVLWFFYWLTSNYGVAIILFTIAVKVLMFPMTIKQQKSMAANARLSSKQAELKKKYGNDKQRLQQETAKLYEKEGVNPAGGCLTSFLPLLIMLGIYYSVLNPLQNTLHISWDKISQALEFMKGLPGIGSAFGSGMYGELEIIKHFPALQDHLTGIFSGGEINNIAFFNQGFNFLGLDLLATPNGSSFSSMLWLIPVLCLVTTILSQFLTQKMNSMPMQGGGCMKVMMYGMPLISAWFAYIVPAAVGFYWIVNTVFTFAQTCITSKFYSPAIMGAKAEAQRVALRRQEEGNMPLVAAANPKKFSASAPSAPQQKAQSATSSSAQKTSGQKKKGKGGSQDNYRGRKKG